jgi:UPF0042 nucleotide-binding protein
MELIIISGISGSGKTIATKAIEDMQFSCIDALPSKIILNTVNSLIKSQYSKIGIVLDSRNIDSVSTLISDLNTLKKNKKIILKFLFLDASYRTIEVRYSETRRIHPLFKPYTDLSECIKLEKKLLLPLKKLSTIIKTDELNPKELRDLIIKFITKKDSTVIILQSFGFKYGLPENTDFVFDVRHLVNPFYDKKLVNKTGLNKSVQNFFSNDPEVSSSILKISSFIKWNIKNFMNSRNFLIFSIGCTGGKHRSVYLVEKINDILANKLTIKKHRDLM